MRLNKQQKKNAKTSLLIKNLNLIKNKCILLHFRKSLLLIKNELNFKNCLYSTSFFDIQAEDVSSYKYYAFKRFMRHTGSSSSSSIRYKDIGFGRCNKSLRGSPMFRQIFSIKKTPFHFFFYSFFHSIKVCIFC